MGETLQNRRATDSKFMTSLHNVTVYDVAGWIIRNFSVLAVAAGIAWWVGEPAAKSYVTAAMAESFITSKQLDSVQQNIDKIIEDNQTLVEQNAQMRNTIDRLNSSSIATGIVLDELNKRSERQEDNIDEINRDIKNILRAVR